MAQGLPILIHRMGVFRFSVGGSSMNIFLWVLQVLLALHTMMGAVWKLSNSEQIVPSLKTIPHKVWMVLILMEVICSLALLLPAFISGLALFAPIAAICIASEMLFFSGVHIFSDYKKYSPMMYWLVVAALCVCIAYGRLVG